MNIISNFLPKDILSHFTVLSIKELGNIKTKKDCIYIYMDEKNVLPTSYETVDYESKGFTNPTTIQDFPIRGKAVYLVIRRRRWRHKKNKSIEVKSDFSFIADGSKLTEELSAFLKGTGRDPRRYD